MKNAVNIQLNTQIWQEGNMYVSYVPQLDLSSCGKTIDEAKKNIKEAMELFLEESQKMGTLKNILRESGFVLEKDWKAPEIIFFERLKLPI